ncbi:SH3 domain-containing protein [Lyticum sinuosum]|uniref:Bacterial SH3 domain protein n=1 Tax=Lyticum sinuosum TaxID=1332059 RepID=A0AAE5AHD8_9RICK|nr:SH3 domain-containing protein [Lyticum sinuosum]MDZ5760998.1 Bacterial SH3 domain protein [Lyticum sinuosum]
MKSLISYYFFIVLYFSCFFQNSILFAKIWDNSQIIYNKSTVENSDKINDHDKNHEILKQNTNKKDILNKYINIKKENNKFISTKSNNTNMRFGPSKDSKIIGNICCVNYPLLIIDKSNNWYYVCDIKNNKGWIHKNLVKYSKSAIFFKLYKNHWNNRINTKDTMIKSVKRAENSDNIQDSDYSYILRFAGHNSRPIAIIKIGAIIEVEQIKEYQNDKWCKIYSKKNNIKGWIPCSSLWGYSHVIS